MPSTLSQCPCSPWDSVIALAAPRPRTSQYLAVAFTAPSGPWPGRSICNRFAVSSLPGSLVLPAISLSSRLVINIPLAYSSCRVPLSSQSVPFQLTLSFHLAPSQFTFSLCALLHRYLSVRFQCACSTQFSVPISSHLGPVPRSSESVPWASSRACPLGRRHCSRRFYRQPPATRVI